ncbi:MAG TPA: hypothetical protein VFV58_10930 [Blastocatellia bacterium]|jgi:hypothetical protein|nr:hypothetical protein [Blastocatellia bacterium]
MHNQAKQADIPTPAGLADNLIGSLDGLTDIEGAELRRQVVMLINHSYALGYVAGAGAGLLARMQSRLALTRRRAGQDIKLALAAIRERLTMIFRDHGRRSHQMFPPTFAIQYPTRGSVITNAVPIRCFHSDRPVALLAPTAAFRRRNQMSQPCAGGSDQAARRWLKAANLNSESATLCKLTIPAPIEAFSAQSTRSLGRYRSRYCTDVRSNVAQFNLGRARRRRKGGEEKYDCQ